MVERKGPVHMKRVAVTGIGALSPLGHDWPTVLARLRSRTNAVQVMPEWTSYQGLLTHLGAPAAPFTLDEARYNRKTTRSMGRVALMATRATEVALQQAGLLGDPLLRAGKVGVAYGSSSGSPRAIADFGSMIIHKTTEGLHATTYLKMMSHSAPVNVGVFFGLTGRIITTSSACTSGSQGLGYAFEAVRSGKQVAMVAGGAEELDPTQAAVFDTLFATSTLNDRPQATPAPFDLNRDGLVLGEGACTFVLEDLEHALARGAPIVAELVGFGTNSDGTHVTQPSATTMAVAMRLALEDAGLQPQDIGYINAHGTATQAGDLAETQATHRVFGERVPISSLKSYMGHTLGACGALEAWMSVEMMREGWMAPTLNLRQVDPACAPLDYLVGDGRRLSTEFVMTNNFAFGGINTSLIFKRWS
jgi:3-oxoacyl-[acyl-carrier-protein] synthase II